MVGGGLAAGCGSAFSEDGHVRPLLAVNEQQFGEPAVPRFVSLVARARRGSETAPPRRQPAQPAASNSRCSVLQRSVQSADSVAVWSCRAGVVLA